MAEVKAIIHMDKWTILQFGCLLLRVMMTDVLLTAHFCPWSNSLIRRGTHLLKNNYLKWIGSAMAVDRLIGCKMQTDYPFDCSLLVGYPAHWYLDSFYCWILCDSISVELSWASDGMLIHSQVN